MNIRRPYISSCIIEIIKGSINQMFNIARIISVDLYLRSA